MSRAHLRHAATALALAVTMPAATLHAAVFSESLAIRVYGGDAITSDDRQLALEEAGAILAQAQVDVQWRDCEAAHPACRQPARPGELLVRLSHAPADGELGTRRALGYSLIDAVRGYGQLATVYADRVAWLAHQGGIANGLLLGRAIAHEIGHLMLGSTEHSGDGLMRAVWTSEELARDRSEDWLFSAVSQGLMAKAWLGGGGPGEPARRIWLSPQR